MKDSNSIVNIFPDRTSHSFVEILKEKSQRIPDKTAYTFLSDGEEEEINITYSELDSEAFKIAVLIRRFCKLGDRVLLAFNPGLDYIKSFYACFYAGVIAVPAIPPKLNRSLERVTAIIEDADVVLVLSHSSLGLEKRTDFFRDKKYKLINIDQNEPVNNDRELLTGNDNFPIAFIQYTSGSTGSPKGVMVSHANLLENVSLIKKVFHQAEDSVIVSWLPFYHDMGLIGGVLVPLYTESRAIILSPVHFTQKPIRWFRAINKYRAATSGGPNFGFELCSENIKPEDLNGLDLSCWKVAFVGAEPVRAETLQRFSQTFESTGFNNMAWQPCYGMAETTLLISAHQFASPLKIEKKNTDEQNDRVKTVVSCGKAEGFEIVIVDAALKEKREEEIGEILVKGLSISKGYWNQPELSKNTMNVFLEDGRGPFLRTGDLGFLKENELYITGRIKDIIIINGRNLYPQDIEFLLTSRIHSLIKDGCAAFSLEDKESERLVIIAEVNDSSFPDIFKKIKELVYEELEIHAAQIVLIRKGTIPKTTSGKIQRYACKKALEEGTLKVLAQNINNQLTENAAGHFQPFGVLFGKIESKLLYILAELTPDLNHTPEENIFSIGLNSIQLSQFLMILNEEFKIDLPLEFIFENPTVQAISKQIGIELEKSPLTAEKLTVAEPTDSYELSPVQHGIWFDQQIKPESNSYNIPVCIQVKDDLDLRLIDACVNEIVIEHEILRTSFQIIDGSPRQVVRQSVSMKGEKINLSHLPEEEASFEADHFIKQRVIRVFDLVNEPLVRYGLVKIAGKASKFFLVAHHLILDGTSLLILMKEVFYRYEFKKKGMAVKRDVPFFQYKDYVRWIRLNHTYKGKAKEYWQKKFASSGTSFTLHDKKGLSETSGKGKSTAMVIDSKLSRKIHKLSKKHNCTNYVTLLTVFAILMFRKSRKNHIILGIPVSGRDTNDLQSMLGTFINAFMLPLSLKQDSTFSSLLGQIRTDVINGLKYQHYPLHLLAKELNLVVNGQERPFTSVFFNGLNFIDKETGVNAFNAFSQNYNLDMNLDLNAYVIESKNDIKIRLDYKEAVFERNSVEEMLSEYVDIIAEVSESPNAVIRNDAVTQGLVTGKEYQQRVRFSNGAPAEVPPETISQQIEKNALRIPGQTALIFKDDLLTYSDLNGKANALAYQLLAKGVRQGQFVPLLMTKSLELPLSILALMKIGAPFVPFDTGWPAERIKLLLGKLGCKIVLTNVAEENREIVKGYTLIDVNHEQIEINENNPSFNISVNSPIYGMFTSGTSGIPKCAVNLHKGILNRFRYMNKVYGCALSDSILFTSRHIFDASVWQMFWPLTNGAKTVIPDDTYGLDLPEIIDLIEREKITVTDFVPSVFNIVVDYLETDKQYINKITSLRQLLIGGEAMNSGAIKKFRAMHPGVGITNTYGPTEASIGTIFYEVPAQIPDIIPIGKPIDNVKAVLLDDNLEPVPIGEKGNLYLGGVCLGTGYLNDPEKTAEVFIKNPVKSIDSEFLYKTGDLARYLEDGNIYFLGRSDNQVKINGIRVECSEIESVLNTSKYVKEAAVLCKQEISGQNYLVAIIRINDGCELNEVHEYLKAQLPSQMIPRGYAVAAEFPKTPTGKVDRKLLNDLSWSTVKEELPSAATISDQETSVREIWQEILGVNALQPDSNFFASGGDSLKAIQLLTRIHKSLQFSISLKEIFLNPTIKAQAKLLKQKQISQYGEITPVEAQDSYELSSAQKRLWFLSKFPENKTAYNMPAVVELQGNLNTGALVKGMQTLFQRHESLRTVFVEKRGVPYQQILPALNYDLAETDLSALTEQEIQQYISKQIAKPFDLEKGPLIHIELLKAGPRKHLLVLTMHHIIGDGWSMGVVINELKELYSAYSRDEANPLPLLKSQYKDYAAWQQKHLSADIINDHKKYWLKKLEGEIPVLHLPTDKKRPASKTYNGARITTTINPDLTNSFKTLMRDHEQATLFMGLLSLVNVLMYRYTGQEDIILGSAVAGREHPELEHQIGCFVNTLALRTSVKEGDTYAELLKKAKHTTVEAYEHQSYPFDQLVSELNLTRDKSRNPVFDVMLVLQNHGIIEDLHHNSSRDLKLRLYHEIEYPGSRFDLSFYFSETHSGLQLSIEYNTDLFYKETIKGLAGHFEQLLGQVVKNPHEPIHQIDYLSSEEKEKILVGFNDTSFSYPHEKTLAALFEEQAIENPHKTALVFKETPYTYLQLNQTSNQLAAYLIQKYGIRPEDIIGIKLGRSEWMIITLLAVLKSGGAYLPIDPEYPEDRINYMLQDSNCKIVIDEAELNDFCSVKNTYSAKNLEVAITPSSLLYVLYTSGSTGKPKGCMLENRGIINRIDWMWKSYAFNQDDVILQKTTFTFDVSVWEIFMPLCWGAKMILCEKEDVGSPERLTGLIGRHDVTCLHFVPSLLNVFISYLNENTDFVKTLSTVSKIITSGEALLAETANRWYDLTDIVIHNLYGPTEASIDVTSHTISRGAQKIPIGKPIGNTQMYIIDKHHMPVPVGVTGEICIAGVGLARGYLNKPDLTAEKFINGGIFAHSQRIYKTGDRGKWLPDGSIEFLGRQDTQVKMRGYRIELGEIETCLNTHHNIKQAIVQLYNEQLVAYLLSSEQVDDKTLKEYLKARLPLYMLPSKFIFMNAFPLNGNGKVDRKKLSGFDSPISIARKITVPRNKTEAQLLKIWAEVLKIESPSVSDTFFSLGGHSLNATQIISRVREEFRVELPINTLFDDPNIVTLSEIINSLELQTDYKPIRKVARI